RGFGFGAAVGERLALLLEGDAFLQRRQGFFVGTGALCRGIGGFRVRFRPRRERELHLFLALGALLRGMLRRRLGGGGLERLARQRLLGSDARLQRRRGTRLGLGAFRGALLVLLLHQESFVQLARRLGFGFLPLLRQARRFRVGLGARLRAAAQVGVERRALARRIARPLLGFRRAARFALLRLFGRDARLQLARGRAFGGGELLGGGTPALLRIDARQGRGFRLGLGLLALAGEARRVRFGAHALFRREPRGRLGFLAFLRVAQGQ